MFTAKGDLWLFVEYLEPAHPRNQSRAKWEGRVVPHWPHLKLHTEDRGRYDCVLVTAVEDVFYVAPDICRPDHYYVVRTPTTRLWHEAYEDFQDGDSRNGDVTELEPDAFLGGIITAEQGDELDDEEPTAQDSAKRRRTAPTADVEAANAYLLRNRAAFTGENIDEDC
jgi:hypothetical protein